MHILPILTTLLSFSLLSHAYDIKPCGTETTTYMPDSCGTCEPFTWYSTGIWPWSWDYIVKGCFQRQPYGYRCVYTGADYNIPKQWFTGRQNVNHGYDTVTAPLVRECFYDKYGQKLDSVDIGTGATKHSSGACSTTARKNDLCAKRAKRIDEERRLEEWYYRPAGAVHETPACKRCPEQKGSATVDVSIANNTLTCDYNMQGSKEQAIRCQYDAVTGARTYSNSTASQPPCQFDMADRGTLACEERLIREAKEKAAAKAKKEAAKAAAKVRQAQVKFCSLCVAELMNQLVVSDEPPLLLNNLGCQPRELARRNCPALLKRGALKLRANQCQVCKDLSLASSVEKKSKFAPFYRVLCRDGLLSKLLSSGLLRDKRLLKKLLRSGQLSDGRLLRELLRSGQLGDGRLLKELLRSGQLSDGRLLKELLRRGPPRKGRPRNGRPRKGPQCKYSASTVKTVRAEGCSQCTTPDQPSSFRVPVTKESIWYRDRKNHPRYWLLTCPKDAKKVLKCPVDQKPEGGSKKGSLPDFPVKEKGDGDVKGKGDGEKGDGDAKEKGYGDGEKKVDEIGKEKGDGAGGPPDGSDKGKGTGDGGPLDGPPEK